MKLQLLHVTCAQCGRDSTVAVMPEGIHGQFILRSSGSQEEVYLDTARDPTYGEVDALLQQSRRLIGKDDWFRAHALQSTYGEIACDPDSTGHFFRIGKLPNCPLCTHASLHSWKALSPPQFLDRDVAPVSHQRWLALSEVKRGFRVDDVLEARGF